MALANYPEKRSLLQVTPRLLQILRVLARPRFIGALRGKGHLPSPKEVRETFEELGLTFVKFGQVLALRRDLLPVAYIKAVLAEVHRADLADVSVGLAFDALLRVGSRNGIHNPGEFFLLTRAFIILESLIRQMAPHYDCLASFREEISRLTKQHFSLERIKEKATRLAREMERLVTDAPGDTRRLLRRIAEGNLGRLQAPAVEALGGRVSRNLERLTGAIAAGADVPRGGGRDQQFTRVRVNCSIGS